MKLFQHQSDALEQTKNLNRVAYYLDMGLGKTFIGSEKMVQLGSHVNLLICQKSKVDDWIDHFSNNYTGKVAWNLTDKKDFQNFFKAIQDENWKSAQHIGVINYELAWRRKDLLQLEDFTLMLDESSLIQNKDAKQSKFILKLNPSNVILLSGTPCSGKYENLWTQIHLLGWNISEEVYNRQYVNWIKVDTGDGYMHSIVDPDDPYKNIERLKDKLRQNGSVFMKTDEVFDLPDQTFIKEFVPSTKEYWKFVKNCFIEIEDLELIGDTSLKKRLYCRQLSGQYNPYKLQAFKELVESTQDRLIVFYNFNEELDRLKQICTDLGRPVSEVNGHCKDLTAYELNDNSITLCQYQAAAKGLNLQKANKVIYFSLTDKCEDWMQSQKRIHRIGQDKPCFYYLLLCKGSVDERILGALEQGVDYTDELFRQEERMEE